MTWSVLWLAPGLVAALLLGTNVWTKHAHRAALDWAEVPCTIRDSRFARSKEGESSLALSYQYDYRGQTYTSDRLDLLPGRTGTDARWERELAERLPPGSQTVCYVNPDDPAEAVLDRDRVLTNSRTLRLLAMPFLLAAIVFVVAHISRLMPRANEDLVEPEPGDAGTSRASLGVAPRKLGAWTTLTLLLGRPKQMFGFWLALTVCLTLFWMLDGPAVFSGWKEWLDRRESVTGTVHRLTPTRNREWMATVYEVTYDYQVAGENYRGIGYVRGNLFELGDPVDVLYDPQQPGQGLLRQGRQSDVPAFLPLIFLGGAALIIAGLLLSLLQGMRSIRLLRRGTATTARFVIEDDRRAYRFSDGFHEHEIACAADAMPDREAQELLVLFDPCKPERNLIYDVECAALPVTPDGALPQVSFRQVVGSLFIPPLAIVLIGFIWWMTLPS